MNDERENQARELGAKATLEQLALVQAFARIQVMSDQPSCRRYVGEFAPVNVDKLMESAPIGITTGGGFMAHCPSRWALVLMLQGPTLENLNSREIRYIIFGLEKDRATQNQAKHIFLGLAHAMARKLSGGTIEVRKTTNPSELADPALNAVFSNHDTVKPMIRILADALLDDCLDVKTAEAVFKPGASQPAEAPPSPSPRFDPADLKTGRSGTAGRSGQ